MSPPWVSPLGSRHSAVGGIQYAANLHSPAFAGFKSDASPVDAPGIANRKGQHVPRRQAHTAVPGLDRAGILHGGSPAETGAKTGGKAGLDHDGAVVIAQLNLVFPRP